MELALDQTSAPAKRASREKIAQKVCSKVPESSFLNGDDEEVAG